MSRYVYTDEIGEPYAQMYETQQTMAMYSEPQNWHMSEAEAHQYCPASGNAEAKRTFRGPEEYELSRGSSSKDKKDHKHKSSSSSKHSSSKSKSKDSKSHSSSSKEDKSSSGSSKDHKHSSSSSKHKSSRK
jgi:hypothetical protein